jgi:Lon-like ATP-dependent protease
LNKHDVEPLLINAQADFIQNAGIPGIRIFRREGRLEPFDIYFCKTKYNVYRILMGLDQEAVEARMVERSRRDLEFFRPPHPRNGAVSGFPA